MAFAIDAGWDNARDAAGRRAALADLRAELAESVPLTDTTAIEAVLELQGAARALVRGVDRLLAGRSPHG